MWRRWFIKWRRHSVKKYNRDIDPDEIFLDSSNLPKHNLDQFEGQIEKPISFLSLFSIGIFFVIVILIFGFRIWELQITKGSAYALRSENNRLRETLVFADRGLILDRNQKVLAENIISQEEEFTLRRYNSKPGVSSLIGYLKYPQKDKMGFYYNEVLDGKAGLEKYYNDELSGQNGLRIVEVDAVGAIQSSSTIRAPQNGKNLVMTIDSELQTQAYETMDDLANRVGFGGGAMMMMDITNGEVLAAVNYPEYSSQVLTDGDNTKLINSYLTSKNKPFLNRLTDGLYTPGSIVKPLMALSGLNEKIIDPLQNFYSSGQLVVPNPYDKTKPSIFKDWKAHGYVDMREAIAVSSNEYFYRLGGGYEPDEQVGLGIGRINEYMKMFGINQPVADSFFSGAAGIVPSPDWKALNFKDGVWRLGDTYNTSIGQYGFQVTPIIMLRTVAGIANNGKIVNPKILIDEETKWNQNWNILPSAFQVVKEGMRQGAVSGVAQALNFPEVAIAAKTGTAEIDEGKIKVNSWVMGYFPYEKPHYAFVMMMEKGPRSNTIGASSVMSEIIKWIILYRPEYLK
ncbi:MAG: penicillin-binding transpeptidase domain-containing protein [Minisyncoccia bacterium]